VGQCYFYVVLSVGRNRPAVTSWRIALETSLNFSSSHKSDSIKKKKKKEEERRRKKKKEEE
jgi:hypothetical protein